MTKIFHSNLLVLIFLLPSIYFTACNRAEQKTEQKPVQYNIPIKVAIIYNLGGAQAVAREDFYLLKKDAVQIWKETGVMKDEKNFGIDLSIDRLHVINKEPSKFTKAVKPYIVKTTTTDFGGNAIFENVPEGEYYIYGITETRSGQAVWDYKVSTAENKTILLDNKNAYYSG